MTKAKAITYRPKKVKRKRKHGYIARKKTTSGSKILSNRRRKGRKRLIP